MLPPVPAMVVVGGDTDPDVEGCLRSVDDQVRSLCSDGLVGAACQTARHRKEVFLKAVEMVLRWSVVS